MENQLNYKDEIKLLDEWRHHKEDELELSKLWEILLKRKILILFLTSITTSAALIFALLQTPIYEAKSNLQLGYIGDELIADPDILQRRLKIIFNVDDYGQSVDEAKDVRVSEISMDKKVRNILVIKTEGLSNNEALNKNREVVKYVQDRFQTKVNQYILETKTKIKDLQDEISRIESVKINDINEKIKLLETHDIAKIDEQIERLKKQDLVKIERKINKLITQDAAEIDREINRLKTQNIAVIDEKLNFLRKVKLGSIQSKIDFQMKKLREYNDSLLAIYNQDKSDKTSLMISSVQMLNYQNLVLNAQNNIEDLKVEKKSILNELIPDLIRQKKNIVNVTILDMNTKKNNILNIDIKNLLMQRDNILNVTILNLIREKNVIQNETIRKLIDQKDNILKRNIIQLKDRIKTLEFNISKQVVQNSEVIGNYISSNHPLRPRKKMIVGMGFITGFIVSIFSVVLIDFLFFKKFQGSR